MPKKSTLPGGGSGGLLSLLGGASPVEERDAEQPEATSSVASEAAATAAEAPPPEATVETSEKVAKERIVPRSRRPARVPSRDESGDRGPASHETADTGEVRVKANARVPAELLDAVRDCVVQLYATHGMTMERFAEEAFRRHLDHLRKTANGGKPFPRRVRDPKPGRRVA